MATFLKLQNGTLILKFLDAETSSAPQGTAELAGNYIQWDPSDQTDSARPAYLLQAAVDSWKSAVLVWSFGAATNSPATDFYLQYQDAGGIWQTLDEFTVAASSSGSDQIELPPPGALKFRIVAASGNLDATHYYAAATAYLAIQHAQTMYDQTITRD